LSKVIQPRLSSILPWRLRACQFAGNESGEKRQSA